jgi:hypothetical protein
VKAQEQARAQQFLADVESRAGEAERQRQRQMVAGAVTGGINALATTYASYQADKKRAEDLKAQAAGAQAAIDMIKSAQDKGTQPSVAQKVAEPMTEGGKSFVSGRQAVAQEPVASAGQAVAQEPVASAGQSMPTPEQTYESYQLLGKKSPTERYMPGAKLFDPPIRRTRRVERGSF